MNMVRHQTIANQHYLVTLRAPAQLVEVSALLSMIKRRPFPRCVMSCGTPRAITRAKHAIYILNSVLSWFPYDAHRLCVRA